MLSRCYAPPPSRPARWASWFTRQMYKTNIGLVMCAFGIAEFIGGFTIGRFVESYGRSPGLAFGTTCLIGAFFMTYSGNSDMSDFCGKRHPGTVTDDGSAKPCKEFEAYGPFYVAAALYGFMDCSFQSIAAAICAKSFNATGNTPDAWALFRTFQALGVHKNFDIILDPGLTPHSFPPCAGRGVCSAW